MVGARHSFGRGRRRFRIRSLLLELCARSRWFAWASCAAISGLACLGGNSSECRVVLVGSSSLSRGQLRRSIENHVKVAVLAARWEFLLFVACCSHIGRKIEFERKIHRVKW